MRRKKAHGERRKKISVELVERRHAGKVTEPYRLLEELLAAVKDHAEVRQAKFAIAWRIGKKADADGRVWLGSAKKGSDLDRALHEYDFVFCLNKEVWQGSLTDQQKAAILDHELSHCAVSRDTDGEIRLDEQGRTVYRLRKHDVEEFADVVRRRGMYKDDIRRLVERAMEFEGRPLLRVIEQDEQVEAAEAIGRSIAAEAIGRSIAAGG